MDGAIILAGGQSRRMGGADKAQVRAFGLRLVDRLLRQLPYGMPSIVISPHYLGLPQVCESPLFGGPVAGIEAGAHALSHCDRLALFAVDAPDSPQLLPHLNGALHAAPTAGAAITRAADGYLQPLCSLWHTAALFGCLGALESTRNVSVRRLVRGADFVEVAGTGAERDYDTPAELQDIPPHPSLRAHRHG
ncbi:molybdenum cofactor guanylyltransferase [Corynebacterium accolens]|uniref:molybdenum cofactor guanylyltransferase n=1 Tax=Corynebacterium accolens TaxID=38284 RepID=UPI001EDC1191|nr:NTP transferase domain-containing protein [Corynebacterium accolens]